MFVLRQATPADLPDCYRLAMKSSFGLTSLPKDKELLEHMLHQTEAAFTNDIVKPSNELYIFCLENFEDHRVVGTSMVRAICPTEIPIPYFLRYPENHFDLLHLVYEKEGTSELCGLFLEPDVRAAGLGKLLSLSRFLFISDHLKRFTIKIFAEIRGIVYDDGNCPFWESVMRPFFQIPFGEAVDLYIKNLDLFQKKIPSYPIYFDLLSKEVQKSIGACHPKSLAAFNFLQNEGFQTSNLIHVLDGGPRIEGYISTIHPIQHSEIYSIGSIEPLKEDCAQYLIATTGRSFRATLGPLKIHHGKIHLQPDTAKMLGLQKGDLCRIYPLN